MAPGTHDPGGKATNDNKTSPNFKSNDAKFVINELLCFIVNKMDIMTSETIVQLCEKTYTDLQIEIAKRKLFEIVPEGDSEGMRYIKRQGKKKGTQNLDDILKKLHELDDDLPTFVAQDLSNLPPISMDSIDVSVLLRKIESLSAQVSMLKTGLATQCDTTKSLVDQYNAVSNKVETMSTDLNRCRGRNSILSKAPAEQCTGESHSTKNPIVNLLPTSEVNLKNKQTIDISNNDSVPWSQVVKTKNKKDNCKGPVQKPNVRRILPVGKATHTGIKSVKKSRVANIFASRFFPNQDCQELAKHLSDQFKLQVTCRALASKFPSSYSSFHIRAECDDPSVFMDPSMWPEGIYYRWYKPEKQTSMRKGAADGRSGQNMPNNPRDLITGHQISTNEILKNGCSRSSIESDGVLQMPPTMQSDGNCKKNCYG